jgi:hypothetical protein
MFAFSCRFDREVFATLLSCASMRPMAGYQRGTGSVGKIVDSAKFAEFVKVNNVQVVECADYVAAKHLLLGALADAQIAKAAKSKRIVPMVESNKRARRAKLSPVKTQNGESVTFYGIEAQLAAAYLAGRNSR